VWEKDGREKDLRRVKIFPLFLPGIDPAFSVLPEDCYNIARTVRAKRRRTAPSLGVRQGGTRQVSGIGDLWATSSERTAFQVRDPSTFCLISRPLRPKVLH
jgi:hypothetical protein